MGGLRRKCHSVLSAKYTSFVITATTHHTHYKTPRSNSHFVEVCHIANDNKSFFCLLLVIIALSLPYSFDRVLNDQELRQRLNSRCGWTSICKSSVMNLGNNPRVLGMEENAGGFGMPCVCTVRSFLPSRSMALRVAMKCIPLQGQGLMEH
jgi:hypothetical protein